MIATAGAAVATADLARWDMPLLGWLFVFATALYNLVRLRNLGAAVT